MALAFNSRDLTEVTLRSHKESTSVAGQIGMVVVNPDGSNVLSGVTASENLAQVNGITVDVGIGAAGTGTQRVAVASNSSIAVSSSALPTGAATETTLSTLNGKVTAVNTGAVVIASSALPTGAATETTLSTLNGKVTACNTGAVTIAGGSLAANQSVNVAQIAGGSTSTVATGVQKVGISDSAGTAYLSAANALNSTGGGIQTAQLVLQFDDVGPTAITENQFGNGRCSANRNFYTTIRDAAGNERGVNVDANNRGTVVGPADLLDNVAYTPAGGTSFFTMMGAEADETAPASVTEGNGGALRMTLTRFLKVSLGDLLSGEDQTNNILATIKKPTAVTTYSLTWDDSAALEASSVSKASAGNLYYAFGFNNNASTRYFQFYNSTTVPADTTVPLISIEVPASSSFSIDLGDYGKQFTTGIAWANSSTAATKTIGSADSWVNVGVL